MAIRLLVENGLAEEALALWRGLFTDSLRLAYLAAEPDETREAVFLNRQRESWRTLRVKFGKLRTQLGLEALSADEIAQVDEQLRKIRARGRRLGVPLDHGYPAEREIAQRFSLVDDFWIHRVASDAVHGNQIALRRRMSKRGDFTAIASRTFDADELSAIGILAMKAALRSLISAAELYGWDASDATRQLAVVLAFDSELEERDTLGAG